MMFKVNKSKSAIGVIALLILATLTPTAMAGKPTPSLNGTLCKSFGGTWKAGKSGTCTIANNFTPPEGVIIDFIIKTGDFLVNNAGDLTNSAFTTSGTITNNGTITNTGHMYTLGVTNNSGGTITNNGIIDFYAGGSPVNNYGLITNNLEIYVANSIVNNSGGIITNATVGKIQNPSGLGSIANKSGGTFNNYGFYDFCIANQPDGILDGNFPAGACA